MHYSEGGNPRENIIDAPFPIDQSVVSPIFEGFYNPGDESERFFHDTRDELDLRNGLLRRRYENRGRTLTLISPDYLSAEVYEMGCFITVGVLMKQAEHIGGVGAKIPKVTGDDWMRMLRDLSNPDISNTTVSSIDQFVEEMDNTDLSPEEKLRAVLSDRDIVAKMLSLEQVYVERIETRRKRFGELEPAYQSEIDRMFPDNTHLNTRSFQDGVIDVYEAFRLRAESLKLKKLFES